MSLEKKNRKELQEICKKHNIKANLTTKEMIKCINIIVSGRQVPQQYMKLSWLDKNKNVIMYGITTYAIILSVYVMYLSFHA